MELVKYEDIRFERRIEVETFEDAAKLAEILTANGYEVLIWTDGEDFGKGRENLSYVVEFISRNFAQGQFVIETWD